MRCRHVIALVLCLVTICACRHADPASNGMRVHDLIEKSQQFDSRLVSVRGFLILGFESRFLFHEENDYRHQDDPADCLSLLVTEEMTEKYKILSGHYVEIYGLYKANVLAGDRVLLGLCNVSGIEVIDIVPLRG